MKVSYNWLKNFVDFESTHSEIAQWLTFTGTEVEKIIDTRELYKGTLVAKVLEIEPNVPRDGVFKIKLLIADNLEVTSLTISSSLAKNDLVAFAPIGARLPTTDRVTEVALEGIVSQGIILTGKELNIPSHKEIIKFDNQNIQPGRLLEEVLPLSDFILEMEVTPNRPDCLSHIGIAREISALNGNPIKYPHFDLNIDSSLHPTISVEIEDTNDCGRYAGRIVKGVKVGKSPLDIGFLLSHLGSRSINNVVDATNYVMLALGHPLHAFDMAKLGKTTRIIVRRAKEKKNFVTLDHKVQKIDNDILCIATEDREVALAGIMGGANSEVDTTTSDILLEAAYFNPKVIRYGKKKLGISSESARRFERGADPNMVPIAMNMLSAKIIEWSKKVESVSEIIDNYPTLIKPHEITLRHEKINSILGHNIPPQKSKQILETIEFDVLTEDKDSLQIAVPTFRPDVELEIDLVEEIGRIYGYDNIQPTTRCSGSLSTQIPFDFDLQGKISDFLVGRGFTEIISHPFGNINEFTPFANEENLIKLANPVSEENEFLRPSLTPSILRCISHNIKNKNFHLQLFEFGRIYCTYEREIFENANLCIAMTGRAHPTHWGSDNRKVDFFDIKGVLEELIQKFGVDDMQIKAGTLPAFTENINFELYTGENFIGSIGTIKPALLSSFDIEQEVYLLQIDFEKTVAICKEQEEIYTPINRLPSIERDISLIIPHDITAADILKTIKNSGGQMIKAIEQLDLYEGENIPAGKKSYTFRIIYQSEKKTLTDEEVNQIHFNIIDTLEDKYDAQLPEG